jgi:hypothetical protein
MRLLYIQLSETDMLQLPPHNFLHIQLSETDMLLILTPHALYSFSVPHYSVTYAFLYDVMRILGNHYSPIQ